MKNAVLVYIQILATIFTLLVFNSCMPGTPAQQDAPQAALAPPCEVLPAPPDSKAVSVAKSLSGARDSGTLFDVAIYWTAAATKGASEAPQIIADGNAILAASGCASRLRLVDSGLYWHHEVGDGITDLRNFTADSTASLRRAKYGADLTLLIVAKCGDLAGTSYETGLTGVVSQTYAVSYHSGFHEMLHECGMAHDKAHSSITPALPYAYGFASTNYMDTLGEAGKTRLGFLSNGGRQQYRAPSGTMITLGSSTADIARAINTTSQSIANKMPSTLK